MPVVNYMVKEFEMKKSADEYKRATISKTGVINVNKLHAYKYVDDIFKKMTVIPGSKNHGVVIILDHSGSMGNSMYGTMVQLFNLTMFCKQVGIPFEVYSFTDIHRKSVVNDEHISRWSTDYDILDPNNASFKFKAKDKWFENCLLLNWVSSKQSLKQYNNAMLNLYKIALEYRNYNLRFTSNVDDIPPHAPTPHWARLGGTPLNSAIVITAEVVKRFQSNYNIQKMNTIFLTDGSSDGNYDKVTSEKPEHSWATEIGNGMYRVSPNWDSNLVLRDTVTKKEYFDVGRIQLTESLLDALRQRTGTKVLGFYISSGKKIDRYTLDHYFPDYAYEKGQKVYDRKKVMAEYRKNKCLIVKDNIGYDEFYLLAGGEMQISDGQMATPSENAKKSELKRLFASTLKSNRDSRIVLNKFIEQVA